jgi:hypothetical protein
MRNSEIENIAEALCSELEHIYLFNKNKRGKFFVTASQPVLQKL